jgi:hypothetical protein
MMLFEHERRNMHRAGRGRDAADLANAVPSK